MATLAVIGSANSACLLFAHLYCRLSLPWSHKLISLRNVYSTVRPKYKVWTSTFVTFRMNQNLDLPLFISYLWFASLVYKWTCKCWSTAYRIVSGRRQLNSSLILQKPQSRVNVTKDLWRCIPDYFSLCTLYIIQGCLKMRIDLCKVRNSHRISGSFLFATSCQYSVVSGGSSRWNSRNGQLECGYCLYMWQNELKRSWLANLLELLHLLTSKVLGWPRELLEVSNLSPKGYV